MRSPLLFWLVSLALALACSPPGPSTAGPANSGGPAPPPAATRTSVAQDPSVTTAPSAPASAALPPARLRVAVLTNSAQDGPVYFADERGYFREQGLEVEVVKFATATEIVPFLAQGQLDVGAGGTGAALFNAIANGLDIRIVADKGYAGPNTSPAWLVRTDLADQLRGPADLRGRVLGLGNQVQAQTRS